VGTPGALLSYRGVGLLPNWPPGTGPWSGSAPGLLWGNLRRMRAVLISGIPATGKTCFGNWLARYHGFRHIDLESDPDRPDPFAMEPLAFIDQTRAGQSDLVITWGFPPWPPCLAKVRELHSAGLVPWWFDGDRAAAFPAPCLPGSCNYG
jgi:hypothetical protein